MANDQSLPSIRSHNTSSQPPDAAPENRYATDWNEYSRSWEQQFGGTYQHLGDEWNDDATEQRKRDEFYFAIFADRFLRPEMTVLEVGPGGGKWSVRLAPRVKKLICLDVAQNMLDRTRARCETAGLKNVEFVLGNGRNFQPLADSSIDFFFSYDVFVHIALEDTFAYIREMNRVLCAGGKGSCHHATNASPQAFNRIEQNNDWYRGGAHTLGQFYYYTPESLRRMYEHCGLAVVEQFIQGWHCSCLFTKSTQSLTPLLEDLLCHLIGEEAQSPLVRAELIKSLGILPRELDRRLKPLLDQLTAAEDFSARAGLVEQIRQLWRGI
jgi:ubiquinone/menaquinone biosynthesis C-methylase UbiE